MYNPLTKVDIVAVWMTITENSVQASKNERDATNDRSHKEKKSYGGGQMLLLLENN